MTVELARNKLREIAEDRLSLYIREMGQEFYDKLVANKANWRAGYLPAHGCFAVFPQTANGDIIVGPFTVVKWTMHELEVLGISTTELCVVMDEARAVGFEKWAAA